MGFRHFISNPRDCKKMEVFNVLKEINFEPKIYIQIYNQLSIKCKGKVEIFLQYAKTRKL